jgi:hypothetical protein
MANIEELEEQFQSNQQLFNMDDLQKSLPSLDEMQAMINAETQRVLAGFNQRSEIEQEEKGFELPVVEPEVKNSLNIGDYARAGAGAFADVFASTAEGLATISGDRKLANSVARTRDHIDEAFTGDIPDELKQNFSYKVANAIGMMPGYVLMALGTGGTGLMVKGLSWLGLASNAYQQGVDDYVASTGDPNRDLTESEFSKARQVGAITTIPIMLLERLGGRQVANAIFRGADSVTAKTALGRLASFGKAPTSEAVTEGLQTFSQNYIAKEIASFDPDRKLGQGMIESMILGGVASGTYSVPAQLMAQHDRLNAGIQNGEINPEELNSDLGRQLMSTAMDNDGVPHIDLEEAKKMHDPDSVKSFVNDVLVPLSSKIGKAGAGKELQNAFRQFERENAVQQGRAEQLITPFLNDLQNLKKKSPEDYEALADALANASLLNKTNETEVTRKEDPLEVAENDVVEVDNSLPVGTETTETFIQNGVKTEIKRRGLTQEEVDQGIDPGLINQKFELVKDTVAKARVAMRDILPDVQVSLYRTNKEFKEATGIQEDVRGAFVNNKIYINSELADNTTVAHEVFHALFLKNTGDDQVATVRSKELIDSILRSTSNEQLKSYMLDWGARYDVNVQNEESLAQMFGVISANYTSLDVTTKTRIKAWFASVAKALGIDGVFSEATTDVEIVNALNAMAQGVARGENIGDTDFQILKETGNGSIKGNHQTRFTMDFVDPVSNLSMSYFQNSEAMNRLVNENRVTFGHKLKDFMKPFLVHRPDNMFTGQISLDGEVVMEGGGGIFFPANTDYFWASTKDAVNDMVKRLNETADMRTEGSDGKVRLVLTSALLNKVQGNSDFLKGTVKITYKGMEKALQGEYKKRFEKDFRRILKEANKKKHPKNNKSLDLDIDFDNAPMSEIFQKLDMQVIAGEYFKQRSAFVQEFFRKFTLLQKKETGQKNRTEYQQAIYDALPTFLNASKYLQESARGKRRGGKLPTDFSASEIQSAYEYMFSEPLLRGYDPFLATQTAKAKKDRYTTVPVDHAYAVIEMPGRVKAIDITGENATYDTAIVSETGEKPTIHILSDRVLWDDFADIKAHNFKKSDGTPKDDYKQVMTAMAGVGNEIITKFKKNYKGYSIAERDLYEPLIQGNPELKNLYETVYPKQMSLRLQKITEFQYTDEEAINALPKKEKAKYNRHKTDRIPMGAIRLNLGSQFTKEGVEGPLFVQTLHKIGKSGKPNYGEAHSYGRAFTVKDASFTVNPIATALIRNGAMNKFPMASVNGRVDYEQEGSLEGELIFFNPKFNDFFVDSQGRFIKSAEEITVYGRGAYARGKIEYFDEAPEAIPTTDDVVAFLKGKKFVHPVFHPRGLVAGKSIKDKQKVLNVIKEKQALEAQEKQEQLGQLELRLQKGENETYEQVRDRILAKHNMGDNYKIISELLQNLYDAGRNVGMDVGYLENFFPRLVKDVRGLQDSYTGVVYDTEIQRELELIEQRRGKVLEGYERQSIIENFVKKKAIKMGLAGSTPGGIKERTIEVIDSERRNKYYASPEEALVNYAQSMIASINQAKLIGTTKRRKGEILQGGRLGQIIQRNLDAGTISNEGMRIIQDAVDARFGGHGKQSSIIKGLKNAGYIATMGNVGSAVTQLGDFYFTGVQTGVFNTISGFAKTLASKDRITREDVMGARNVVTIEAQEGAGALSKAVDWFFKASGITQIDALAKNTNINANYTMMRKAVRNQNSKAYKKLFNELVKTQGMRDASKAISDLRSGIKSDQVLQALFNRLSDVAPISLIEMPQAYAENPNARILYSLKSYTIKQFDFLRQQSFQKMAKKDTFVEGFTNLFRIGMLAMLANGSADVLKAILFNREIDEEDLVFNNILRIFGVTKYTTVKAQKEGIGEALVSTVAPPQLGILNDLSQDVARAISEGEIDIDELRSVKYIPLVGKLYYWREGRGVEVEERLSRLRD